MKLALTVWNGRISPVFDVARQLLVLEVEDAKVVSRQELEIGTDDPFGKVSRLVELGVETLVCGAISRPLAELISGRGVRLLSFVAGDTEQVIEALLGGALPSPNMAMPGCCGRRFRGGGRGRGCPGGRRGWSQG